MDISRRAIFALPAALPVIMLNPPRSTAWTVEEAKAEAKEHEAREERGCCAGWIESFDEEHEVGYLKCFDGRKAFFQGAWSEFDAELVKPGTKVFVYWAERPNSLRHATSINRWIEA